MTVGDRQETQEPTELGRAAVLVDLENLVGAQELEREPCRVLRRLWVITTDVARPVWSVAACNDDLAGDVVAAAHRVGLRVYPGEKGPNRADRELVDRATTDLPHGIDVVVLASGDGDFIPLVWQQQRLGRRVVAVSWASALSRNLARVVDEVRLMDELELAA